MWAGEGELETTFYGSQAQGRISEADGRRIILASCCAPTSPVPGLP